MASPLAVFGTHPATATAAAALLVAWSAVNLVYQVIRKPTELFFPVSGALAKPPAETWRQYAPLFREYATTTISPTTAFSLPVW